MDFRPERAHSWRAVSGWLTITFCRAGRAEAEKLFERLLTLRNDVGLLAEEYDPESGRLLGNFPQAFSHVALVNTALNIGRQRGPAGQRSKPDGAAEQPHG